MMAQAALPVEALETVGLVFGEALALYVGYGAVTAALEPRLTTALTER